jgi:SAM-dependent methyltransferase
MHTWQSHSDPDVNLWSTTEHSKGYLQRADSIPHRREGEATLLEFLPERIGRFLDLGSGGGRLLGLVKAARPDAEAVAVDFSAAMLDVLRDVYRGDAKTLIVEHDLSTPLPELGKFDAVISSFAIHHVTHERKRSLYRENFRCGQSGWSLPESGARCVRDRSPARRISVSARPDARNRRSIEQASRCRAATALAPGDRICRCRLPLEMARTRLARGREARTIRVVSPQRQSR